MRNQFRVMLIVLLLVMGLAIGQTSAFAADKGFYYNPTKAIEYAAEHWEDEYEIEYGEVINKVDCVKFVRACVEAGGIPAEEGRTWGYTPQAYVEYLIDNGYAKLHELTMTEYTDANRIGRCWINSEDNEGIISPGDILVYYCTIPDCEERTARSYFHLELVGTADGAVTCYGHNPAKGNEEAITFPHSKCKTSVGATDADTKIMVLHFDGEVCDHSCTNFKTTTKASFSKNGVQKATCACKEKTVSRTLEKVPTPEFVTAKYTFNNKTKSLPAVKVVDAYGNVLVKNPASGVNGYTVANKSGKTLKSVGSYAIRVTLKGNDYSGYKTLDMKINPPKKSISKIYSYKKAFKVKWAKPSSTYRKQISGYQIKYSKNPDMTNYVIKKVSGASKTYYKKSSLSAKKTYYVQMRTYKIKSGKYYYSDWSSIKSVTTK